MPVLIGQTKMRLFRGDFLAGGEFLDPMEADHRSVYAPLYGPLQSVFQMYSRTEESHFDRLRRLFGFGQKIGEVVSAFAAAAASGGLDTVRGYAAGSLAARGAYNDLVDFFGGMPEKTDIQSQHVEIVYPTRGGVEFIEVAFEAFNQEDQIVCYFTNPEVPVKTAHGPDFGVSISTPHHLATNRFRLEGDDWDQRDKTVYRINLHQLFTELGDAFYGDLPLVFGFSLRSWAGDMSVLHFMNLKFVRPLSPRITNISPKFAAVGELVSINGERFTGVQNVTAAGGSAEIVSKNDFELVVRVPSEAAHEENVELVVDAPGGTAAATLLVKRALAQSQCDRGAIKVGDIIGVEGIGLERTANVTFLRQTHLGRFDHPNAAREFSTTWQLVPGRAGGELNDVDLRRILVSVPSGMSEQVAIRITQQYTGARAITASVAYDPGAPMIESTRLILDPQSTRFNQRGRIFVSGINLLYAPTVYWGEVEVTDIASDEPNSLSFATPEGVRKGRIEVRTPYGVALSPETVALPADVLIR